jgi:hypothetical protein
MLRAMVGLCLAVALCGLLSQCLSAGGQPHAGYGPSPPTPHAVSTAPAVVIDLELETELSNQAAELLAFDLPGEPAVSHLVMGRMDRQTTHLELLLTCGRLLI